jgi:hypothetical protein
MSDYVKFAIPGDPPAKVANPAKASEKFSNFSNFSRESSPSAVSEAEPPQGIDVSTPLESLLAPAHIWSNLLQADFWVCATKAQAARFLAEGKVVYLPEEIRVLRQLKDRWPASFAEKLRAIHQSKTVFGALVVDAALPEEQKEKEPTG